MSDDHVTEKLALHIANSLIQRIEYSMLNNGASLNAEIARRVASSSADYIENHMYSCLSFKTTNQIREFAASRVKILGLLLEFGVWKGESINFFAKKWQYTTLFGFDSFMGLQEDWAGTDKPKGTFSLGGQMPQVDENVTLVKGWFNETLPGFLEDHVQPVSFLHVDCDTYDSAKYIFETLSDRLVPGTIVLFDEYFNYPGWQHGEHRAWKEFTQSRNVNYRYLCYALEGPQVVVEII